MIARPEHCQLAVLAHFDDAAADRNRRPDADAPHGELGPDDADVDVSRFDQERAILLARGDVEGHFTALEREHRCVLVLADLDP